MPESWRNILERAASNLSIELDRNAEPAGHPNGWHPERQASERSYSSVERCDLLARELEALCRPERRPDLPKIRRPPGYPAALYNAANAPASLPAVQVRETPEKSNTARELAALSVSVAVVVLAIYGFLFLLK